MTPDLSIPNRHFDIPPVRVAPLPQEDRDAALLAMWQRQSRPADGGPRGDARALRREARMTSAQMTPAMQRGLAWFADQYGGVSYFKKGAPGFSTRQKLLAAGLVERRPVLHRGRRRGPDFYWCISIDGVIAAGLSKPSRPSVSTGAASEAGEARHLRQVVGSEGSSRSSRD